MSKSEMKLRDRERWAAALDALPALLPSTATWEGSTAILSVLAPFAESGCNYVLLPRMGGMGITAVRPSRERDCVELVASEKIAYVVRPERVTLEHFPAAPLESFLLVELGELEPSGVYDEPAGPSEELVEADGDYVARHHWDEGTLGENDDGDPLPLPDDARLITRFLGGKLMVVSQGSIWNGARSTDVGRHSAMESGDLRRLIAGVLERLGPDYLEQQLATG